MANRQSPNAKPKNKNGSEQGPEKLAFGADTPAGLTALEAFELKFKGIGLPPSPPVVENAASTQKPRGNEETKPTVISEIKAPPTAKNGEALNTPLTPTTPKPNRDQANKANSGGSKTQLQSLVEEFGGDPEALRKFVQKVTGTGQNTTPALSAPLTTPPPRSDPVRNSELESAPSLPKVIPPSPSSGRDTPKILSRHTLFAVESSSAGTKLSRQSAKRASQAEPKIVPDKLLRAMKDALIETNDTPASISIHLDAALRPVNITEEAAARVGAEIFKSLNGLPPSFLYAIKSFLDGAATRHSPAAINQLFYPLANERRLRDMAVVAEIGRRILNRIRIPLMDYLDVKTDTAS